MNDQNEIKPDVVLSDGKSILFDKHRVKYREIKSLFDVSQPDDEANEIVARFAGLAKEYVDELTLHDRQLLWRVMFEVVRRPVDPNSASGSTLP